MVGVKNYDYYILNFLWWLFFGVFVGFIMFVGVVLMFYDNGLWMFLIGFVGVFYVMFGWWFECVVESY